MDDNHEPILDLASLNLNSSEKLLKHYARKQVRRKKIKRMRRFLSTHKHECQLVSITVQDYLQCRFGYLVTKRNASTDPDQWSDHYLNLMLNTAEEIINEYDDHEKRILRQRIRDLTSKTDRD